MDLGSPAHCLTFHLSRAARSLQRGFEEAARATGLTSPQFSTLALLDEAGPLTVTALARQLGTDRTTLTRNLDLLKREGLIEPVLGDDRRQRGYRLSASGVDRLARAMPAWGAWQHEQVERLGEDGARTLLAALEKL